MNLYTLNVIQPDKMSLWKYIKESEKIGNLFIFSSIWQWLKFPIFALFLMCLFCSIFIFVFGTIEEISSDSPKWDKVIFAPMTPFIIIFPPSVILIYYKPKTVIRKNK